MKKNKTKKMTKPPDEKKPAIVIDSPKGLVFQSEEDLFQHFLPEITYFEEELFEERNPQADLSEEEFVKFESHLTPCLEFPDEIWEDTTSLKVPVRIYIKYFEDDLEDYEYCYHIAICYMTGGTPSFVYLHFPTVDMDLVEYYRRGEIKFDRSLLNVPPGAIEGDALTEGDELAIGLYKAMMMVRSEKDIAESEFKSLAHLREETLDEPDEIWRNTDISGNILVTFVREFPDEREGETFYLVITLEDMPSSSHALLFSFPTNDPSLAERYRHGENLQAEEVIQESSH